MLGAISNLQTAPIQHNKSETILIHKDPSTNALNVQLAISGLMRSGAALNALDLLETVSLVLTLLMNAHSVLPD